MALTTVRPQGMGFNTGRRNLIINGAMQVAQRGTSDSAAAANSFIVDRFMFSKSGVDNLVVTTSQSTDAPDGFSNSYKIEATTAESALGANDLAYIRTKLEAQNLQHLKYGTSAAEKVTASFWVKASSAGQYTLTLFQDDGSDLVNKTYSVSSTNTWEYKTITFPAHTTAAIANDNGFGLSLNWIILAGTDFTSDSGAQGAWDDTYANAKFANGHTVTSPFMTTNGTFQITGVQLELGENASDFEHRSAHAEQLECFRYYYDSRFGSNDGGAYSPGRDSQYGHVRACIAQFPVKMRATPTVSIQSSSANSMDRFGRGQEECFPKADNIHADHFQNIVKYTDSGQGTTANWTDSGLYINRAGYKADAEL